MFHQSKQTPKRENKLQHLATIDNDLNESFYSTISYEKNNNDSDNDSNISYDTEANKSNIDILSGTQDHTLISNSTYGDNSTARNSSITTQREYELGASTNSSSNSYHRYGGLRPSLSRIPLPLQERSNLPIPTTTTSYYSSKYTTTARNSRHTRELMKYGRSSSGQLLVKVDDGPATLDPPKQQRNNRRQRKASSQNALSPKFKSKSDVHLINNNNKSTTNTVRNQGDIPKSIRLVMEESLGNEIWIDMKNVSFSSSVSSSSASSHSSYSTQVKAPPSSSSPSLTPSSITPSSITPSMKSSKKSSASDSTSYWSSTSKKSCPFCHSTFGTEHELMIHTLTCSCNEIAVLVDRQAQAQAMKGDSYNKSFSTRATLNQQSYSWTTTTATATSTSPTATTTNRGDSNTHRMVSNNGIMGKNNTNTPYPLSTPKATTTTTTQAPKSFHGRIRGRIISTPNTTILSPSAATTTTPLPPPSPIPMTSQIQTSNYNTTGIAKHMTMVPPSPPPSPPPLQDTPHSCLGRQSRRRRNGTPSPFFSNVKRLIWKLRCQKHMDGSSLSPHNHRNTSIAPQHQLRLQQQQQQQQNHPLSIRPMPSPRGRSEQSTIATWEQEDDDDEYSWLESSYADSSGKISNVSNGESSSASRFRMFHSMVFQEFDNEDGAEDDEDDDVADSVDERQNHGRNSGMKEDSNGIDTCHEKKEEEQEESVPTESIFQQLGSKLNLA